MESNRRAGWTRGAHSVVLVFMLIVQVMSMSMMSMRIRIIIIMIMIRIAIKRSYVVDGPGYDDYDNHP